MGYKLRTTLRKSSGFVTRADEASDAVTTPKEREVITLVASDVDDVSHNVANDHGKGRVGTPSALLRDVGEGLKTGKRNAISEDAGIRNEIWSVVPRVWMRTGHDVKVHPEPP